MALVSENLTNDMVREFIGWEYPDNENEVPILTWDDITKYLPEMIDPTRRDREFVAYCISEDDRDVFVAWVRGRCLDIDGTKVTYLGYAVHPDFQGRGIGKQALLMAFPIFAQRYGKQAFVADIEDDNLRSIRLVEGLNFNLIRIIDIDDCGKIKRCLRYLLEI